MDDWSRHFETGYSYREFLDAFANSVHRQRWNTNFDTTNLSELQRNVIQGFVRRMRVLCVAGTWCGDCARQCPIFARIAETAVPGLIDLRFVDRDTGSPELIDRLRINGGRRVPAVVFFSEEGYEVARYGEKTLAQYRDEIASVQGNACSLGLPVGDDPSVRRAVISEWVDQFERAHAILRLSPRLREKYGD